MKYIGLIKDKEQTWNSQTKSQIGPTEHFEHHNYLCWRCGVLESDREHAGIN